MATDEGSWPMKFYKLLSDIASRRDLTAGAKLVWAVVADHIGKNDSCWPGVRKIAADSGLSVSGVIKAVRQLESKALLQVDRRGIGRSNHYYLGNESALQSATLIKENNVAKYKQTVLQSAALDKVKCSTKCNRGALQSDTEALYKVQHNQINQLNQTNILRQNSNEFRLAELLLNLILERKSDFRKPNLQMWAVHVERMVRLDKRKLDHIEAVIYWCQADSFWQNNILSAAKLREKFDQLELKMTKENRNGDRNSKVGTSGAKPNPVARPGEFVR